MELSLPQEYYVITRDTPADDAVFEKLGVTKEAVLSDESMDHVCLSAINESLTEDITVSLLPDSLGDFAQLNDRAIELLLSMYMQEAGSVGIDISAGEVYHHQQTKFLRWQFAALDGSMYGEQYMTSFADKSITFNLRSYVGPITEEQQKTLCGIVDSTVFDGGEQRTEPNEKTPPFEYTDPDTNTSFTVPAQWHQQEFLKPTDVMDVQFANEDAGLLIGYGSVDLWSELTALEKIGLTRADINMSQWPKADFAESSGVPEDQVSSVTYNGKAYYKVTTTTESEIYGVPYEQQSTTLFYADNGWVYNFVFSDTDHSPYYADFEQLLNSVQYPVQTVSRERNIPLSLILAVPAAAVVLIVVFVKKRRKNLSWEMDTTDTAF